MPTGDSVGDAHEVAILKLANADAQEKTTSLIPDSKSEYGTFQEIIGGAWETILARKLGRVGEVDFMEVAAKKMNGYTVKLGKLNHLQANEQLPAIMIRQSSASARGNVVWVPNEGKLELFNGETLDPRAIDMLDAGFNIISADLMGQGEFSKDGKPLEAQRMWYQRDASKGWQRFAGYTYGYNHSVFVQRTHDVLSLIKLAGKERPVHLIGIGKTAGPIALAARSQAGSAIQKTFIDLDEFRFQYLTKHDDPMFVSGAVRYLDVDGLLSLCAPGDLTVSGQESKIAIRVYKAAGAIQKIRFVDAIDFSVAKNLLGEP